MFGPVFGNDLGWRLRHVVEPCELLGGTNRGKYMKFKR